MIFELIAAKRAGVLIVRIRENVIDDHPVAFDANSGAIIDSAETYPLELIGHNLEYMDGKEANNLKVREIRRVIEERKTRNIHSKDQYYLSST